MSDVNCTTCQYWEEDIRRSIDDDENRYGRCRRHAPRPGDQHITWPRTEGGSWCGEYQGLNS